MIKVVMTGGVSITRPEKKHLPRPMRVMGIDELIELKDQYQAYMEYVGTMAAISFPKPSSAAFRTAAKAVGIKRYMEKMYKRWILRG